MKLPGRIEAIAGLSGVGAERVSIANDERYRGLRPGVEALPLSDQAGTLVFRASVDSQRAHGGRDDQQPKCRGKRQIARAAPGMRARSPIFRS